MVAIEGVGKQFPVSAGRGVDALRDISLAVEDRSFVCILGPSGSGKSTLLRCIAGLERPDTGVIRIGGADAFNAATGLNLPPQRRRMGLVFQSYAIWPHMTVFQNVAFPLVVGRGRRPGRAEVTGEVERALATVGLSGYGARMATQLSGGEQQRVALARAIVGHPVLLLLDEPLSNLDAKLRERMRFELKQLHQNLGVTTVYVTHDQQDALFLADRIAVMRDGRVVQTGTCDEIYRSPADRFVAEFVGGANFFAGAVDPTGSAAGFATVRTAVGPLRARLLRPPGREGAVTLCVRPEDIRLCRERPDGDENRIDGEVVRRLFLGEKVEYWVTPASGTDPIRVTASPRDVWEPGEAVVLVWPAESTVGL